MKSRNRTVCDEREPAIAIRHHGYDAFVQRFGRGYMTEGHVTVVCPYCPGEESRSPAVSTAPDQ